jgi:MFS family permease
LINDQWTAHRRPPNGGSRLPEPWNLPAVYAISLCGGLVSALEAPVMGRFNATVVDRATLGNALSLGSLINSTGRILGMSVGGIVIAAIGPAPLFVANAISFLGVVVAPLAIRPDELHTLVSCAVSS